MVSIYGLRLKGHVHGVLLKRGTENGTESGTEQKTEKSYFMLFTLDYLL